MSNYNRVKRPLARRHYNQGRDVYLLPSKAVPGSMWIQPYKINKKDLDGEDFAKVVNLFERYNCNPTVGTYTHFYIER